MARDKIGITISKSSYWQKHINCWRHSGLSQAQYCQKNMLALSTFTYWKKKLSQSTKAPPRFYPLTIQGSPQSENEGTESGLRLVLGTHRFAIEVSKDFSATTLVRLVKTLDNIDSDRVCS